MPQHLEHSGVSWKGQQLRHDDSWLDTIDPRARIVAATLFAVEIVLLQQLLLLALGLVAALLMMLMARLDLRRTLRRVIAMDLFMVFLVLMLPFTTPGDLWFEWRGMHASWQGLWLALAIVLKSNAVILMLLALVGTQDATQMGHALARLKVPEKLVHLMLFTVRYLDVIGREYRRMRNAMRARAFVAGSNLHTWRSLGYLVGMLLVRSLERSERIMAAMKCRGYHGQWFLLDDYHWRSRDTLFVLAVLSLLLGMAMGEWFL